MRTAGNVASSIYGALFGAMAGALAMFFLDPDQGGRRRGLARRQLEHAGRDVASRLEARARQLRQHLSASGARLSKAAGAPELGSRSPGYDGPLDAHSEEPLS